MNEQLTEPATEPETLEMVKRRSAVDHDDDNASLELDIQAARKYCETHTGLALGLRTYRLHLAEWPLDREIPFPVMPVTAVGAVKYKDTDDVEQTVDTSLYRVSLVHNPPFIRFVVGYSFPVLSDNEPFSISIDYTAGLVAIPATIRVAIQMLIEYWRQFPGGEPTLGHLSRGAPGAVVRLLDSEWTGG